MALCFISGSAFAAVDLSAYSLWGDAVPAPREIRLEGDFAAVRVPSDLRDAVAGLGHHPIPLVAARFMPGTARSAIIVGLRMRSGEAPSAFSVLEASVRRISEHAGFHLKKIIGSQPIPNSADTAVVILGDAPVSKLGALMGDSEIVKVLPAPRSSSPAQAQDFLSYATSRTPWLILLTIVMAVLSFLK